MDAARARELPMSLERNLVMLHTMKPHYDPVKEGVDLLGMQRIAQRVLVDPQILVSAQTCLDVVVRFIFGTRLRITSM